MHDFAKVSTGIFSVASARRRIDEICLPNIGEETKWVKCVPIKINVLAWKIKTDALPTRFNISRRGIDIQDMSCPICDNAIESTDHLFFRCGLVRDIANKVLSWWNLDHANLNSYAEWKSWLVSIRMDSKLKKMFEGVCCRLYKATNMLESSNSGPKISQQLKVELARLVTHGNNNPYCDRINEVSTFLGTVTDDAIDEWLTLDQKLEVVAMNLLVAGEKLGDVFSEIAASDYLSDAGDVACPLAKTCHRQSLPEC
ncbi:RNA-directed DNA polymerase, eukaryota [Tanacetum coccineum]